MNITLIGMAGAGKTTVGKMLAKRLRYSFLDIDRVMEDQSGMRLQQMLDNLGDGEFIKLEEKTIIELGNGLENAIISTGGSIIYSPAAMEVLKNKSVVIFLDSPFNVIRKRLKNRETRGIVRLKDNDLEALFKERLVLYRRYADITISIPESIEEDIADEIIEKCQGK